MKNPKKTLLAVAMVIILAFGNMTAVHASALPPCEDYPPPKGRSIGARKLTPDRFMEAFRVLMGELPTRV